MKNAHSPARARQEESYHNRARHLHLVLPAGFAVICLFILGRYNYLLFHSLVELGAVAVAWSVFFLVWNARRLEISDAFILLGIGYAIVGALDLLHTLAYEGMGVFEDGGTALATQLWIAARFIETAALFFFPLCFILKGFCRWGAYALVGGAFMMLGSVFAWNLFPECFNEQTGLTPFKIASEYFVMGGLAGSAVLTYRKRNLIGPNVSLFLCGAMLVTIVSEFCFTLYASAFGAANMAGHLFKVVSFMLIYRALIVESLERPMETLAHGLRKETERYARIMETAVDGFWIVDRQGRIRDANASAERMSGFSRGDLLSKRISDIDIDESAEEIAGRMKMLVEKGPCLFEARHRRKDGSMLDVELSCSFLPYDDGQFIVFVRDISERKIAARMLEESEARYRGIVSALPDLLFRIDSESRFTDVQTSVPEMLVAPEEEIIRKTAWEILPPDIAELTDEKVRATLQSGKMQVYHYAMDVRGVTKECETRMVPFGNSQVLAIVRDVTEARDADRRLRESEARYNAIVNDQTELICRFDAHGVLGFVNRAYCSCFGLQPGELIGRSFFQLIPEKDREFVEQQFTSLTRQQPVATYEHEVIDRDGNKRWMEWKDRAIFNEQGDITTYQAVGRDVTERKILQQSLMRASEREQVNLARELHDGLCQDLKGLEIQAALLEDRIAEDEKDLTELASGLSSGINSAVRRAYGITQGMFPIELGTKEFSKALKEFAQKTMYQGKINLAVFVQDDSAPKNSSQAHQLYRIAQEAVNNALQHSNATEMELTWREENGGKLLSIRDNGTGIRDNKKNAPGGLGLQVMMSRAESINARLTVRNRDKGGTEVLVRLKDE